MDLKSQINALVTDKELAEKIETLFHTHLLNMVEHLSEFYQFTEQNAMYPADLYPWTERSGYKGMIGHERTNEEVKDDYLRTLK